MGLMSISKEFTNFALKSFVNWKKFPDSLKFYFEVIVFKFNTIFRKKTYNNCPKRANELVDYINGNFRKNYIINEISSTSTIEFPDRRGLECSWIQGTTAYQCVASRLL